MSASAKVSDSDSGSERDSESGSGSEGGGSVESGSVGRNSPSPGGSASEGGSASRRAESGAEAGASRSASPSEGGSAGRGAEAGAEDGARRSASPRADGSASSRAKRSASPRAEISVSDSANRSSELSSGRSASLNASPNASPNVSPRASRNASPGSSRNASPSASRYASPDARPIVSPSTSHNASPSASRNASPGASRNASSGESSESEDEKRFLSPVAPGVRAPRKNLVGKGYVASDSERASGSSGSGSSESGSGSDGDGRIGSGSGSGSGNGSGSSGSSESASSGSESGSGSGRGSRSGSDTDAEGRGSALGREVASREVMADAGERSEGEAGAVGDDIVESVDGGREKEGQGNVGEKENDAEAKRWDDDVRGFSSGSDGEHLDSGLDGSDVDRGRSGNGGKVASASFSDEDGDDDKASGYEAGLDVEGGEDGELGSGDSEHDGRRRDGDGMDDEHEGGTFDSFADQRRARGNDGSDAGGSTGVERRPDRSPEEDESSDMEYTREASGLPVAGTAFRENNSATREGALPRRQSNLVDEEMRAENVAALSPENRDLAVLEDSEGADQRAGDVAAKPSLGSSGSDNAALAKSSISGSDNAAVAKSSISSRVPFLRESKLVGAEGKDPSFAECAVAIWRELSHREGGEIAFQLVDMVNFAKEHRSTFVVGQCWGDNWRQKFRREVKSGESFLEIPSERLGRTRYSLKDGIGFEVSLNCYVPSPKPTKAVNMSSMGRMRRPLGGDFDSPGVWKKQKHATEFRMRVDSDEDDADFVPFVPNVWTIRPEGPVRLSVFDIAPNLRCVDSPDGKIKAASRLVLQGVKGYRSARATHGVTDGDWYFEVSVLPSVQVGRSPPGVRLGWSTRLADVETPVGTDKNGWGVRDVNGHFIHNACLYEYGESFGVGDTIGCRLVLPEELDEERREAISSSEQDMLHYRFVGYLQGQKPCTPTEIVEGGYVEFFKNGQSQGIPLQLCEDKDAQKVREAIGMPIGRYYPCVSLFKSALVHVNFGPDFKFPPPPGAKPVSDCGTPDGDKSPPRQTVEMAARLETES